MGQQSWIIFFLLGCGLLALINISQGRSKALVLEEYFNLATKQGQEINSNNNLSVAETATKVTVRILTEKSSGSGVIIERQGQIYTVLTCDHVVNTSPNNRFTVLTPDGKTYQGSRQTLSSLKGIDLALIKFQSSFAYEVVAFGDLQTIALGDSVYASGFPNYYYLGDQPRGDTLDWGLKAYHLTTGTISMMLSNQSLPGGYRLGYTNEVTSGMSGGPVLDEQGKLIGITGLGKYPLGGIDELGFTDGTLPTSEQYQQMELLSWAIPISTVQQYLGND